MSECMLETPACRVGPSKLKSWCPERWMTRLSGLQTSEECGKQFWIEASDSLLSGPISRNAAILSLRYPISRDTFSGRLALPQNGGIPPPPMVLSFTQAHLCDTPFCNISRDNCAIPDKNQHKRVLRYYRYKYRAI